MSEFEAVLVKVIEVMDRLRLPYMLTGGLAVTYYGEPRTTHDIDLVVVISAADVTRIKAALEPDFFVDEESIRAALREGSMFYAIHKESGFKVDFWMLREDAFSQVSFSRRVRVRVLGIMIALPTAEDVIIGKLDWFKQSDIDKHYSDALGVCRVQAGRLDISYIEQWCRHKTTFESWQRLLRETGM